MTYPCILLRIWSLSLLVRGRRIARHIGPRRAHIGLQPVHISMSTRLHRLCLLRRESVLHSGRHTFRLIATWKPLNLMTMIFRWHRKSLKSIVRILNSSVFFSIVAESSRRPVCHQVLGRLNCRRIVRSKVWIKALTLWRPLLPHGYSYTASSAGPG